MSWTVRPTVSPPGGQDDVRTSQERYVCARRGPERSRSFPGALLTTGARTRRLGDEQRSEGRNRRMADYSGVLLLSVHAAVGAGGDDAAAVGRLRPQRHSGRGDGRPVLLRVLAV